MTFKLKGIKFNQPKLLVTALTHRSALNEVKGIQSYERLEFLGDAVLELIVSDYLYRKHPNKPEGDLTHLRSQMVQTKTLAKAATRLRLGESLVMSKGETAAQGSKNVSLLADCFEAVIGAIYLDQGLDTASKFIHDNLLKSIDSIIKEAHVIDYKSSLQESWQKQYQLTPVYKIGKVIGPDHDKTFQVSVYLNQEIKGTGKGKSKQDAQQQAAKSALEGSKTI